MSAQELSIAVNGVSRATILDLVETHGNVAYRYISVNDDEVEVSITHYPDPDQTYDVEIDTGGFGSMMSHRELSSAIDWFFELIEQNPVDVSSESETSDDGDDEG